MSKTLDAQIDALYAVPLAQFVAARTALARTVAGDEAKRIKALAKPTTLPWVINQLRWHERALYERVLKVGAALRRAQVAALEGRGLKLTEATAAHRAALADAVTSAVRLAQQARVNVDADAVQRMLETISLAESLNEPHGRFTEVVQPAGFEALFGIAVKPAPSATRTPAHVTEPAETSKGRPVAVARRDAAKESERQRREEQEAREAEARHAAAIRKAEELLAEAREQEVAARNAWHAARDRADAADRELQELRSRRR